MIWLDNILIFFGLKKAQGVGNERTPARQLAIDLEKATPESRQEILNKSMREANTVLTSLDSFISQTPADKQGYLYKLCQNFELLVFIYQHKKNEQGDVTWRKGYDKDYETVLDTLPTKFLPLKQDKKHILEELGSYVEKFEEHILLSEAHADYKIQISENGKWIQWPFLSPKLLRPSKRKSAGLACKELFFDCPSLKTLEFESRVPWNPISLLEVKELGNQEALNLADFSNNKFYTYLF